jgi:hypothetical protein
MHAIKVTSGDQALAELSGVLGLSLGLIPRCGECLIENSGAAGVFDQTRSR